MTAHPISELPDFIRGLMTDSRDVLFVVASNIKLRMEEPGKTRAPGEKVDWDGEIDPIKHTTKQQRAFFATNGFGGGIPYIRSGAHERAGVVEIKPFGASLIYPHPWGAISGLPSGWQSKIHRNKWIHILTVLSEELNKLPDLLRKKFTVRSSNE